MAIELPSLVEKETIMLFSHGKCRFGDAFIREGFQNEARCGVYARKLSVKSFA